MNHSNLSKAAIPYRCGAGSRVLVLFLASLLGVAALAYLGLKIRPDARRFSDSKKMVRVYCAAGIVKPVEQIVASYNNSLGGKVEIVRTGGSGELAGQIKMEFETGLSGGADIFISADDILLAQAHSEGIVSERFAVARQKAVIAVSADSQLAINSVRKMIETDDLRFGIASEQAAVGKVIRDIANREGLLEKLEANKSTDAENVMTLAQSLVTGSLDAAVIWDTTVAQINQSNPESERPLLKIAAIADSANQFQSNIALGIVSTSEAPTESLRFARYLTAPETGKSAFERFGFSFIVGDRWEEVPEIHLYCGSMFTPVLETAVREFANREGVNIYPRWEGCGKLVASMKSIEDPELFPDAYLACDVIFLDEVKDLFRTPTTISTNQIVMAARKDLKHDIHSPEELLSLDLRIGICDPDQSALGRLTQQMLSRPPYNGLYQKLKQKTAVTVDVGPTLMSQLLAGGLDIAFVYRSNVMASPKSLEILRIIEIPGGEKTALATQPWAVSRKTANPLLMDRFMESIGRPEIQKRFKEYGFQLAK